MKEVKILGDRRSGRTYIAIHLLNSDTDAVLVSTNRRIYEGLSYKMLGVNIINDKNFIHLGISKVDTLINMIETHLKEKKISMLIIDDSHRYEITNQDRRSLETYCKQLIEII